VISSDKVPPRIAGTCDAGDGSPAPRLHGCRAEARTVVSGP
jgi:hypothetical protein